MNKPDELQAMALLSEIMRTLNYERGCYTSPRVDLVEKWQDRFDKIQATQGDGGNHLLERSMSQHDTLTLEPCPFCGNEAHFVDDLIIVYASCPNCGATGAHSSYRSGAAEAWNRRAALSDTQPAQAAQSDWGAQQFNATVYPPDGTESPFTVINLGSGKVQMGDSIHDGRLPALWFGINGQGMGHEEIMNREARPGETLAVVTFANVEGLDVLLEVIQRIRREKFPEAQAAQGAGEVVIELKRLASACPELNLNNYGPDDVDELNAWAVEVAQAIDQLSDTQPAAGADVLLDALRDNSWDLVSFDRPTGGDDADIGWRVIEHHMEAPTYRRIAEVFEDDPSAAIRAAIAASGRKS